jgi:hypothetical protein
LLHPWVTGDWLIHYSNGFIRRGLLGEIALLIANYTNQSILNIILWLKFSTYLLWLIAFYFIALRRKIGIIELVLIASPWAFLFDLHDPQGSGRKEILLFATYALYLVLLSSKEAFSNHFYKTSIFWYLLFTLPILTITHEGLFFYFPFFCLPLVLIKRIHLSLLVFFIPYLISCVLLIFLYLFFKGDSIDVKAICDNITLHQISPSICQGAINSLNPSPIYFSALYFKLYLPIFLLTTIPQFFYLRLSTGFSIKKSLMILFWCWIPTLPLYFISVDWGRWIHISALLILMLSIFLKTKYRGFVTIDLAILLVGLFYIFCWFIPHSIVGLESIKWTNFPLSAIKNLDFKNIWISIGQ